MKLIFMGTPEFAVPSIRRLIEAGHEIRAVFTQPDRPVGRKQVVTPPPVKTFAAQHGLTVLQPEKIKNAEARERFEPLFKDADAGIVAAYGRILPEWMLAAPRHGCINVHSSLLPKYRGAAPVHRAIINGETETGVTIMQVVEALDAGDMLAKSVRPIGPDETSDAVERALADAGAQLLLDVLDQVEAGTARAEPQDASRSTYASRLTKEEGLIDWTLPARRIHDRVRGLYPWPHAYSFLDGERVILLKTAVKTDTIGRSASVS